MMKRTTATPVERLVTEETIEVLVEDLYQVRQGLEHAMKLVDRYLSHFTASKHQTKEEVHTERPEVKATPTKPKAKSLGVCMFVNKRILKEKSISTREELESCGQRCSNKANLLRNGLLLCSRHKDSDVSKIEDIVNGVKPVINTRDLTSVPPEEGKGEIGLIEEGSYGSERFEGGKTEIEEAIEECTHLERLLEDTDRIIPCRLRLKECCLALFDGVHYVVEPMGECYGKITNEEKITAFSLKMKMREYVDISGSIEALEGRGDLEFLQKHSLTYKREYQN